MSHRHMPAYVASGRASSPPSPTSAATTRRNSSPSTIPAAAIFADTRDDGRRAPRSRQRVPVAAPPRRGGLRASPRSGPARSSAKNRWTTIGTPRCACTPSAANTACSSPSITSAAFNLPIARARDLLDARRDRPPPPAGGRLGHARRLRHPRPRPDVFIQSRHPRRLGARPD